MDKIERMKHMRLAVQMFAQTITDDNAALSIKSVYPEWEKIIGKTVPEGFKFMYGDDLYKVIQPELTLQDIYPPGTGTESLYTKIDETHAGTAEDPIPYNGNMELFSGKYYIQENVLYLCTRDSGTPLYHNLADLVGVYVTIV